MAAIRQLSPELAKLAVDELGEDPARIPADLQAIKDWLSKQRHIKARTDDQWLIAFLRGCKYSLERTKEKIDNYYTMKTMVPEMISIDPLDPVIQDLLTTGVTVMVPKPISANGPRVFIIRPGTYDPSKYTVLQTMRLNHMFTDMLLGLDDHTPIAGGRAIIDLKGVTMGHFAQMTPGVVKKMVMAGQEALPVRQKGTHHVNTPPGVETVFSLIKTFMNEKNKSRLFVHNENMEELHKFIPKEILPTEYGGDAGPIQDMIDYGKKMIEGHRDWFLEHAQYKTDEAKRPGRPKTAETLFGIEGSFRQLNVD